jgi:hypothetical protein
MVQEIPFYIVCFNRVYGLQQAMAFVKRSSIPLKPVVLDMGSTWSPFISYRDSLGIRIEHFKYGIGPRDLFVNGFLADDGKGPFFFSDGDLDYSETANDAFENMKKVSEKYPWFPKIGLALPLSDVPYDDEGRRVRKWERDNWRVKFSKGTYLNGVDTTIAYYPRREETFYYRPSLRLAASNSAIHYPWYERKDSDEAIFYSSLARASISSTAAGDTPAIRYRIKHAILICLYFASCIPLRFSVTGPFFVRMLARNGTIRSKRIQ